MRTIMVELFDDGLSLSNDTLGRAGEKNVVQFSINFEALRDTGLTTATLLYQPRNSPVLAMPSVDIPAAGRLISQVPDWAMSMFGVTQVQLQLTGEGVETRSYIWHMRVERSLINYGDKPTPVQDWLQEVRDVIDDAASLTGFKVIDYFGTYDELIAAVTDPAPGAAYGVGTAAPYDVYVYGETSGWTNIGPIAVGGGGTGAGDGIIFVPSVSDDGTLSWENNGDLPNPEPVNIKGADGFSPTISTEQVLGGHRLTIENPGGNYEQITIRNGTAPTVRVDEIAGGNRVTITGANGPTSFDVMDGGGTVDVDATLTQEGMAADAKATGEAINKLADESASRSKDKPLVYIDGVIPTTKDNVQAEMRVVSNWLNIHAYIMIKCQGTSSLAYDKKNFTVTLYKDEARAIPMPIKIPGWKVASNKFVLKANWIDHSHARNIVAARLWGEVVQSRADYDALPSELRNSPNHGAVDGFPIIVYTNGDYQGLYTWNIGKDAWLFGMDEGNPNHILLCNENNSLYFDSCNFRALWDGDENRWAVEVGSAGDAVKNALNALISIVMNTDDATFMSEIETVLDVQSAIDYYLHQYVICGLDGLGKNMLLATYNGAKWHLSAYDMDSTMGLWWQGDRFVSAEYRCPYDYEQPYNLLFERVRHLYRDEMTARYAELRKNVYSYANIMSHYEKIMDFIGVEAYADDLVPYPDIPSASDNNKWQLRTYVRDRLRNYCDPHMLGDAAHTAVEYIEGDGSSWINTGIYPDADMVIDIVLQNPAQETGTEIFFGTRGDGLALYHYAANYIRFRINDTDYGSKFGIDGWYPTTPKRTLSLDLSVVGNTWTSADSLLLFSRLKAAEYFALDACGTYRLYSFKVTRKSTGTVLLDMTPAVDVDGRPGMHDSVSQRMFYNDGTGTFAIPVAEMAEA